MRSYFPLGRSILVVAVSVWMVTCGDPQTRNPNKPSGALLLSPEVIGPPSIAPGQSRQFSVLLHLTDGTVKSPPVVVWSSSSPLLQVNGSGVASAGQQMGEAVLSVSVPFGQGAPLRITHEVVIVPDGTYRVVGNVKDAEFPTSGVKGARLDVTPGSVSATTDSGGNYRLYGVPADASIHIAQDGYQPFEQSFHLTGNVTQSFVLTPINPHLHLGGAYTVAIDAAPGCSGPHPLPEDLQHRSYQATVTQTGLSLQVTLTEPRFKIQSGSGNRFFGFAGFGSATFSISGAFGFYYYYYYPDIVERLANGTVLVVAGSVTLTGTAAGLSGQLDGDLSNYSAAFPNGTFLGICQSQSHQFTLTPR